MAETGLLRLGLRTDRRRGVSADLLATPGAPVAVSVRRGRRRSRPARRDDLRAAGSDDGRSAPASDVPQPRRGLRQRHRHGRRVAGRLGRRSHGHPATARPNALGNGRIHRPELVRTVLPFSEPLQFPRPNAPLSDRRMHSNNSERLNFSQTGRSQRVALRHAWIHRPELRSVSPSLYSVLTIECTGSRKKASNGTLTRTCT